LVNGNSASASEIVSGSIQDLDRGVVMGARSFGKGLVQRPLKLTYGTQLKVTISRYFTPSGRCIQSLDYWNRDEDNKAIIIKINLIVLTILNFQRVIFNLLKTLFQKVIFLLKLRLKLPLKKLWLLKMRLFLILV